MTSKQLQVVNDVAGTYGSVSNNTFYDMPTGDVTGENSHWYPDIFDAYASNVGSSFQPLSSHCGVLNASLIDSGFTSLINKEALFSSYTPNSDHDTRFCFRAEFQQSSMGRKLLYMGAPNKTMMSRSKARWTSSVGLQYSISSKTDSDVVVFNDIYLIYYKYGDSSLYFDCISKPEPGKDKFSTYGYISDEGIQKVKDHKLITVGCAFDVNTRGTGYIDVYDFKMLRSKNNASKKSVLVMPAPHTLESRIGSKSIPIV